MLFKNAIIYQAVRSIRDSFFGLDGQSELEKKLESRRFTPCKATEPHQIGWKSPFDGDQLSFISHGHLLLRMSEQTKVVPPQLVNKLLKQRIELREEQTGIQVRKFEQQAIKDDIVQELLPKAFPKTEDTYGLICADSGLVVVDAASKRKADMWVSLVRKTIGSFPIVPVCGKTPAEVLMSQWLRDDNPDLHGFRLGSDAKLKGTLEDGGTVSFKDRDLQSHEVRSLLENSMMVREITLAHKLFSFKLNDDVQLKSIRWSDAFMEQNDDVDDEQPLARFDADFFLMASTFDEVINGEFSKLLTLIDVREF